MLRRLDRFWFQAAPASRLALIRILVGTYALAYLLDRFVPFGRIAESSPSLFEPAGPVPLFLTAPMSADAFRVLLALTIAANVAFLAGWCYRLNGPLFAVLLLWVLSYRNSWGMIYHYDNLLVLYALILGLAPAADVWSFDALGRRLEGPTARIRGHLRPRDPAGDWEYGSAIRLLCAVAAAAYFLAGVAKVLGPYGLGWGTGEALRVQVAFDGLRKDFLTATGAPALLFAIYNQVWLFTILGLGTLILELGAPLVLFWKRLVYPWVIGTFLMHWGIYFIMGIEFPFELVGVAFAPFLPLERLLAALRRRAGAAASAVSVRAPVTGALVRSRPKLSPRFGRALAIGAALVIVAGGAFAAGTFVGGRGGTAPPMTAAATATPGLAAAAAPRRTVTPSPAPRQAVAAPAPAPCAEPCASFQVVWVGDILLADAAQRDLDRNGYTWPFEHLRSVMTADYLIGNAEGPITDRTEQYFPDERWHYNAQPVAARALAEVGFNALGLSNNHALDRGPEGLADTLHHIRAAGIQPFGAGKDRNEAAAPLLVQTPYGIVGVVGISLKWRNGAVAGTNQPGTIPITEETVVRGKELAKAGGARWVVAYVHWGENYEPIEDQQRRYAAMFAGAGYDLLIGAHPHVVQEVEVVQGMPVLYSVGNFVFGSPGRFTPEMPGYGLVVRTHVGAQGLERIELTCIVTDNDVVKFQPRPCQEAEAQKVMQRLGPSVAWENGKGVVRR